MADKRPRIGVVGSSNVDLVTYVDRMPIWGETIAAPRFEMSHGGKGANQAVARRSSARLSSWCRKSATIRWATASCELRARGRRTRAMSSASPGNRPERRRSSSTASRATIASSSSRAPTAILRRRHRARRRRPEDLRSHLDRSSRCRSRPSTPALAFGRRHGVKTVLNPAPAVRGLDLERARDASFLMPNETELAILTGLPVELRPRSPRGGEPRRQGRRSGHRHPRRSRRSSFDDARRRAPRSRRSRSRRSTPPAPATPSSAASPATSPPVLPSMPR